MKNSIAALLLIVGATAHGQSQDLLEPIPYVPEALGPYEWNVTTVSPRAQRYFNQGMQLRYGFSMPEAARSMAMARRIDPNCAMCFWGEAFALGSFLNGGMSKEQAALAREAILEAEKLIPQVGAVEADLIKAALLRYPDGYEPTARRSVDQAFADAMAKVHDSYPQHSEVSVIYATALFLLERRRGYRDLNDPKLLRIHELLTAVLEKDPAHPGACHLYIHATESTAQPSSACPARNSSGMRCPGRAMFSTCPPILGTKWDFGPDPWKLTSRRRTPTGQRFATPVSPMERATISTCWFSHRHTTVRERLLLMPAISTRKSPETKFIPICPG